MTTRTPDELPKEERDAIRHQVNRKAQTLFGGDDYDYDYSTSRGRKYSPNHEHVVGICATCSHYQYAEDNMHQIVHANCDAFDRPLGKSKIKDCSAYEENGRLSLAAMFGMATLIDPPKTKIGFGK